MLLYDVFLSVNNSRSFNVFPSYYAEIYINNASHLTHVDSVKISWLRYRPRHHGLFVRSANARIHVQVRCVYRVATCVGWPAHGRGLAFRTYIYGWKNILS